jgi:hypothetical protein
MGATVRYKLGRQGIIDFQNLGTLRLDFPITLTSTSTFTIHLLHSTLSLLQHSQLKPNFVDKLAQTLRFFSKLLIHFSFLSFSLSFFLTSQFALHRIAPYRNPTQSAAAVATCTPRCHSTLKTPVCDLATSRLCDTTHLNFLKHIYQLLP